MALQDERIPPDARRRLERIHAESQRVAALVRNVLKISHRDTGERKPVELRKIIQDTVEVRRHDFTTAGMRIDMALAAGPLWVVGSELELHQVFLNIVNNAFDALRESGPLGRLSIRAESEAGRAVVRFSDNGPGMKDPRQVFEHFYTTKPVGQGTGLGLAICYAIVRGHEGRIAAENLPDGGARFTIELPLAPHREAAEPAAERRAAEPRAADQGPLGASVLVVDDEPTIVDLQKEILESLGATVVGASSGSEAIERLGELSFDLIVSDVRMPGRISGRELFRWVEENRPDSTRGFVFITGDTAGDGSRDFVDGVGAPCLMKPFSTDEYVRVMRETYREVRRSR
jgi:CheY-like chemotaxis protein